MNQIRVRAMGAYDKALTFWQKTQISDLLYRRLMRGQCPHPEHRVRSFDDHGQIFTFCGDCREPISR